ncbi:hypothetical protein IPL85_02570 [Candidatus Saccharibacteria bacterium]|nr:MAG: hypothetical protein IPL85_02570 [Candidatus Saccharibacteria bacterium]
MLYHKIQKAIRIHSLSPVLVVAGCLALTVSVVVWAANVYTSLETESGTVATAIVVGDASASGGQAVKFGAAGSCTYAGHVPDGTDGFGGCWPGPNNTGVPDGTTLTNYTGPCTITTNNTVIDAKTVNCDLHVRAQNVTITRSMINGYIETSNDSGTSYNYAVTDSTIHVADINYRGLLYSDYIATRVDVSGGQSMAWCDTCTIQDSYLHNPLEDPEEQLPITPLIILQFVFQNMQISYTILCGVM